MARATKKKSVKKKSVKKTATAKKASARKAVAVGPRKAKSAAARAVAGGGLEGRLRLRLELEDFYAAYAHCLDHGRIEDWPDFFTDDCLYKLISRENFDLGLPLGTMFAEKRGGLLDRVVSVKKTTVYHERYTKHFITGIEVTGEAKGAIAARANYVVMETLPNQYTQILNAGRYEDKIVRAGGKLKFKEKLCIFDSVLVPASIIYPI